MVACFVRHEHWKRLSDTSMSLLLETSKLQSLKMLEASKLKWFLYAVNLLDQCLSGCVRLENAEFEGEDNMDQNL